MFAYVNGDKDLYFNFSFDNYSGLKIGIYSMSRKLNHMLRGE